MKTIKKHIQTALVSATAAIAMLTCANLKAGAILESPLIAGDESFGVNNGAAVVSGGVEVDTTADTNEWHEYFVSVPEKIKLEAGKSYRLSYDYTINKAANEKTQFYHIFRNGAEYSQDRQESWSAASGSKGHKEFTAKLDAAGYRLILGVRNQGAIRIENLRVEEVVVPSGIPFSGPVVTDARFLFADGAAVVGGGIEVDTTAGDIEWHEYFKTVPENVKFVSGKHYVISYDYKVVKIGGTDTEFYHLLRTGNDNEKDVNMELWTEAAGSKGHKEITVALENPNYKLILGVRFKGAIRIENLNIAEQK